MIVGIYIHINDTDATNVHLIESTGSTCISFGNDASVFLSEAKLKTLAEQIQTYLRQSAAAPNEISFEQINEMPAEDFKTKKETV